MPWCLKSGDEVVAELGPELPQSDSTIRSWPLRLTSAFERIRPIVDSIEAVRHEPLEPIPTSITTIADPGERAQAIQAWLRTNPSAQRRMASSERLRALDLTVVNAAGNPITVWRLAIAETPGLPGVSFEPWMRSAFERAGFRGDPPFYMVVASVNPPPFLVDEARDA